MPILLDTPFQFSPGHNKPIETYNEVKIVKFAVDIAISELHLLIQYGNTVSGVWVAGQAQINSVFVENLEDRVDGGVEIPAFPAYDILVGTSVTTGTGISLYNDVAQNLYQYLIDQEIYEGTII